MFILSIVLITLALVFYTIGVWSERIQGELKWWQVGAFALGFAADTSGTTILLGRLGLPGARPTVRPVYP